MKGRRSLACAAAVWVLAAGGCPAPGGGPGPSEGEGDAAEGEGDAAEGEGDVAEGEGEGEGDAGPFFLAVGYGGRRLVSLDGANWTFDEEDAQNGSDDDNLLRGACAAPGVGLAVGGSLRGRILTTSGGSFHSVLDDDLGWLGACAAGNGTIIAAGSARSIRSTDGGLTWTDARTRFFPGGSWEIRAAAFGNGTFVAVGGLGVHTSADGVDWSDPAGPAGFNHVAFGNGVFVAVGNGKRGSSSDGVTWAVEDKSGVKDVVFDGARFVIVGDFLVQLSDDGVVWDEHTGEPPLDLVAFGAGTYASSTFSNNRRSSADALTWSEPVGDEGNAIASMVFVP